MDSYTALSKRHMQELNDLPMFFAFSRERLEEHMKSRGLETTDYDKICEIGMGGFCLRTDFDHIREVFAQHAKERRDAMDGDKTGEGYIFYMFRYELWNHEYEYTRDVTDTLEALDLTHEDVEKDPRLRHGLKMAIRYVKNPKSFKKKANCGK